MSKRLKLGVGIAVGALAMLVVGGLIGVLIFKQFGPAGSEARASDHRPASDWAAKFDSLTPDEKLRRRLAGVDGANRKAASNGCVLVASGPNQDVYTITAPIQSYSDEMAETFAKGVIEGFLRDEQTTREMIALDITAIVVTDGKRSWRKELKTGMLTTKFLE